jgi:glycosyltransferase involved in cell wall biosynthesis
MAEWHIITGEYPPQPGGVSDYTRLVAMGLAAAGDSVHVWCPRSDAKCPTDTGVSVHRVLGRMLPHDLFRTGRLLNQFPKSRRILVQWVPHAFGLRSANLPLSFWLWSRGICRGDQIEVMIHEPYLPMPQRLFRHKVLAIAHRVMLAILLRAARYVWIAIPKWEEYCRPYASGRRISFRWLPVVSNIPVQKRGRNDEFRNRYVPAGRFLIGHFGTCGGEIGTTLRAVIPRILRNRPERTVLLIGPDSHDFRSQVLREHPELSARLHSTGALSNEQVSLHISACDVMLQPYPDGASSRRGSLLAGLSHGKAIVTTSGVLTESLWRESGAVKVVPSGVPSEIVSSINTLLADPVEREQLGIAAKLLYAQRFELSMTIQSLRRSTEEFRGQSKTAPAVAR